MGFDGWDDVGCHINMGGMQTEDPEIAELTVPVHVLEYQMVPDMAGAGEWRGGQGARLRYEVLPTEKFDTITMGSGHIKESVCSGVAGGKSSPISTMRQCKADGRVLNLDVNQWLEVEPGDIFELVTMGGGGFGNPFKRPVEKVREDVVNQLLSVEKAKEDYGVAIDPLTLEVDCDRTEKIRNKQR